MEAMIPTLLGWAVLLPLLSFVVILVAGPRMGKGGSLAGGLATAAIVTSAVLSLASLKIWITHHPVPVVGHHDEPGDGHGSEDHAEPDKSHSDQAKSPTFADPTSVALHDSNTLAARDAGLLRSTSAPQLNSPGLTPIPEETHNEAPGEHGEHAAHGPLPHITGDWYTLATFGDKMKLTIGYYIDALTIAMFCMVTLISSCIHVYAMGYMHEELHDVTDHEVHLSDGSDLQRPGRYPRFFQFLSLFCFSMLGLVVAGNIAMTFVFWELVGICSYFLIGFYVERQSASTAANKAFIVNRVGDFGMIIGLMALWGSLGTFAYGDIDGDQGIFSLVRPLEANHAIVVPDGMVMMDGREMLASGATIEQLRSADTPERKGGYGYWLLFVAGVGIFCGCVGKSAQFPLHVWLPDAMEGPTPVSALVHSATMVAAGVFLVARFYPVFTPDVLMVIAITGTITLFMAATIAITATDIKRVLAYSTVSQLGYMMTALGVGGWLAGTMHLITHAFFKSLLFMCSGSVIHAVHTNEMTEMGGLRKKMPWTAYTMLIGCLAIAGAGVPFLIGFSGYYSKDAIVEQALLFRNINGGLGNLFFVTIAGGAAITAFYMFRLWYMTFAGTPRDEHRYDHAHESPRTMYVPLVLLAIFAICIAWHPGREALLGLVLASAMVAAVIVWRGLTWDWLALPLGLILAIGGAWWFFDGVALADLLEQARPDGTLAGGDASWSSMTWPNEHDSHAPGIKIPATVIAFGTALGGILLATVFYCWKLLDPEDAKAQFQPIYRFLLNKWWFDELYDLIFVKPTHVISRCIAVFDRRWIDGLIDGLARGTRTISSVWERIVDRGLVDGTVDKAADLTYSLGLSLRGVQTGKLRQYVLFIVVGTVAVFVAATFFWGYSLTS